MSFSKVKRIAIAIGAAIGFFFLICIGFLVDGGTASLFQFLTETAKFVPQMIVITAIALVVVWISQRVRSWEWFDRRGSAKEMAKVEDRIGTEYEQPGDAMAVAIKYSGTTLLIAVILLAKFLMHTNPPAP